MGETKFTSGPWTSAAEYQQLDLGESIEVFESTHHSPIVMNFDDFPCLEEGKAEDFDIEAQANARLIAASPNLYEAAKKALTCASLNSDVRALIVAAIARVEEKQ